MEHVRASAHDGHMTPTSAHSFVAETIERRMQLADERRIARRESAALRRAEKAAAPEPVPTRTPAPAPAPARRRRRDLAAG
jgi:hypothetical protein